MAEPAKTSAQPSAGTSRLGEVARLFLRLGFTAFGGPAAHTALMEDEVVRRRGWIDRQHFLDLLAAINFIPGPNSTELAIHLGLIRAGFAGLVVAGCCFIVPAVLIILPLGWAYVHYATLPAFEPMMAGINAAVVAIVAAACWRFAGPALRDRFTVLLALAAFAVELALQRLPRIQPELIVLALAGLAGAVRHLRGRPKTARTLPIPLLAAGPALGVGGAGLWQLALVFLKIGATLFGSGYVLVTYLQSSVVDQYGWLTGRQLGVAVAVGQFTPGPLTTTATFVGYLRGQALFHNSAGAVAGAFVATLAVFFPSFVFVALLGRLLPYVRANPVVRGALDAMNAAVVALIAVVTVRLGAAALWPINAINVPVAVLSLFALIAWNVNATWLIVAAGLVGIAGKALHIT